VPPPAERRQGCMAWHNHSPDNRAHITGGKTMLTVTITHCYGDRDTFTSRHRTDSKAEAIERAAVKHYGKQADFVRDNGISNRVTDYGQIGRPCSTGGTNLITGRVAIRVDGRQTITLPDSDLIRTWMNSRVADVDDAGDVWIDDPMTGHWLDDADKAAFVAWRAAQ